jgi:hypothetical protein
VQVDPGKSARFQQLKPKCEEQRDPSVYTRRCQSFALVPVLCPARWRAGPPKHEEPLSNFAYNLNLLLYPKDVQQLMAIPYWTPQVSLNGYLSRLPSPPTDPQMQQVLVGPRRYCLPRHPQHCRPTSSALISTLVSRVRWYHVRWL